MPKHLQFGMEGVQASLRSIQIYYTGVVSFNCYKLIRASRAVRNEAISLDY
jgi:hypothetical protein